MNLDDLRQKIDNIDKELINLFEQRMEIARYIGRYKAQNRLAIYHEERENALLQSRAQMLQNSELSGFADEFFTSLMSISRAYQTHCTLKKNIVLTGIMGSGKTVKGKLLAKKLSIPFIDMDEEIEKEAGISISEIFNTYGEVYFRNLESEMIQKLSKSQVSVISTGGGVIKNEENMQSLKETGIIIFLNRDINDIIHDIDTSNRPLLTQNPQQLYEIYRERLPLYKKWCDIEISGIVSVEKSVDEILSAIERMPI